MTRLDVSMAAAGSLLLAAVLAGCTLSTGGGDPSTSPSSSLNASSRSSPTTTRTTTPAGVSLDDLSADVLSTGGDLIGGIPVATGTAEVDGFVFGTRASLTIDIMALRRTAAGTYLALRMTSDAQDFAVGDPTSGGDGFNRDSYIREIWLDDEAVSGNRYRPYQYKDSNGDVCVCPVGPLLLGAQPQLVTAVYPPLPDGVATVTLRWANSGLVVENVPVSG